MTDTRPNILLITTDQQRYDSLRCYGVDGVHTPVLDGLAADGVVFDRCYTPNTICTPARASLWTGKHLYGHGVHRVHDCLPDDETLFPWLLRQAGYDTALLGKLHVAGHIYEAAHPHPRHGFRVYEWTPDPRGYGGRVQCAYHDWLAANHPAVLDRLRSRQAGHLPMEAHLTTWAAERTISFLREGREEGKPFFCCMSVFDPHNPYDNEPIEMRALLRSESLPAPVGMSPPACGEPAPFRWERERNYLHPFSAISQDRLWDWRMGYHAAVSLIDVQVGRVLEVLRAEGLEDNTLVLFTSDHGDMLGDHRLLAKGCFFFDPCTRVPLVARWPGRLPCGQRVHTLCQLHDLAATCLRVAGFESAEIFRRMPESVDLTDPARLAARTSVACVYANSGICSDRSAGYTGYFDPPLLGAMWREDAYKLNWYESPSPEPGDVPGELYDMRADPLELSNLWEQSAYSGVRDEMMRRLTHWLTAQRREARPQGIDARPEGCRTSRSGS